jgi:hypothetical protein
MLITVALLTIGLALVALSLRQLIHQRRLLRASINGAFGSLSVVSSAFISLLLLNLQTYVQLTKEMPLAEIEVVKVTDHGASVTLIINSKRYNYLIAADEWRLDARFLKWKPWLAVLGKDPIVRLESFSGKLPQSSVNQDRVYQLATDYPPLDELISYLTSRLGMVDTLFGSSVFMPNREGARYLISATHSGLVARPVNNLGRDAIKNWD